MTSPSNLLPDFNSHIFLSYRRLDTDGHTGWLYDSLCNYFEKDQIFMDIDSIKGGDDFVTTIENALASCRVLIAVIGRQWNIEVGGKRILDNPKDFVRIEIARALARNIKVIPLLVGEAPIPLDDELPTLLKPLLGKQIMKINSKNWKSDVNHLVAVIKEELLKKPYSLVSVDTTSEEQLPNPMNFIPDDNLKDIVNLALSLKKPLLITGEPGVGKSMIAHRIAFDLHSRPLIFYFKSSSKVQDIFYSFDVVGNFFSKEPIPPESQIQLGAMGLAILLTLDKETAMPFFAEYWQGIGSKQSVVLLEGVDKAPRDILVDVFNEIQTMEFSIKEINKRFKADQRFKPIIIFTADNENELPREFLRGCIFYRILFPTKDRLTEITKAHFQGYEGFDDQLVIEAIDHFLYIRNLDLKRKPSMGEYLTWIKCLIGNGLNRFGFKQLTYEQSEKLRASYSVLAKNREDINTLNDFLYEISA
jgi:MoxR-like ATPase